MRLGELARPLAPAPTAAATEQEPETKADQDRLGEAIGKLAEEDPTFKTRYDQDTGQTLISVTG